MKIGACLFNSPDAPGGGWACRAGETPVEFGHPGDLPSDCRWLTNANYRPFRNAGLHTLPNLADNQYLRTSSIALLNEFGMPPTGAESAKLLAGISARCIELAEKLLEMQNAPKGYRFAQTLQGALLDASMRKKPAAHINSAMTNAYQINQGMRAKRPAGSTTRIYLLPRMELAKWLLAKPIPAPGGEWTEIRKYPKRAFGHAQGKPLTNTANVTDWLIDMQNKGQTAIFQISVASLDPAFAAFASFGAGTQTPREWAPLPEVLHLSRFSSVTIQAAWQTSTDTPPLPQNVLRMLQSHWADTGSGLFLENILAAYALPLPGPGRTPAGMGVWQRAWDRIITSRYAEALAEHAMTIGSHAYGRIVVFARPGEEKTADDIARKTGLIPPARRP